MDLRKKMTDHSKPVGWLIPLAAISAIYLLLSALGGLMPGQSPILLARAASSTLPPATSALTVTRFAVIGDFGVDNTYERSVADLIKQWQPDFVITVGDNNYPTGAANVIDKHIGQFYHAYIYPYTGSYGPGAAGENRFWPALGNHDWNSMTCNGTHCTGPYLDYFTLPNNERYYDLRRGPVHLFFVDSDANEPDGIAVTSTQALWLQQQLTLSTAPWKLVILHHAPYSSGAVHGSTPKVQWPYKAWGASAVLAGHDHLYERLEVDGLPYFVNGLGGAGIYTFAVPLSESQSRYNCDYGAMLITASALTVTFQFIDRDQVVIDSYTLPESAATTGDLVSCSDIGLLSGLDDVEERLQDGNVYTNSSDLEMVNDLGDRGEQVVGVRFQTVTIPNGAQIEQARLEFVSKRPVTMTTNLIIHAEASDDAPPFSTVPYAISTLPLTAANLLWKNVPAWSSSDAHYQTPNLAALVQEVVNRPGWVSGNALAFVITGNGERAAYSYEGDRQLAPRLLIKYRQRPRRSTGISNYLPLITAQPQ